jgi:hypothetical protein
MGVAGEIDWLYPSLAEGCYAFSAALVKLIYSLGQVVEASVDQGRSTSETAASRIASEKHDVISIYSLAEHRAFPGRLRLNWSGPSAGRYVLLGLDWIWFPAPVLHGAGVKIQRGGRTSPAAGDSADRVN